MSNRSLIEINHDFCHELNDAVLEKLKAYLRSASRETANDLKRHGITVVGMRHHSGQYYLDGEPEGFPAISVPRREPPPPDQEARR